MKLEDEIREILEDHSYYDCPTKKDEGLDDDGATDALLQLFKKHWLEILPSYKLNQNGFNDGWNKAIDEMRKKVEGV